MASVISSFFLSRYAASIDKKLYNINSLMNGRFITISRDVCYVVDLRASVRAAPNIILMKLTFYGLP